MSYEDLEHQFQAFKDEMGQRIETLEEAVAHLKTREDQPGGSRLPLKSTPVPLTEDDLIDGVEYDIVLNVPAKREYTVEAVIVSVERGRQDLALSDMEWACLQLEDEDE